MSRVNGVILCLMRFFLLAWIIPIVMSFIVYFGFTTNYTGRVFSEASFNQQYLGGVYKYRVLGRILLIKTHDLINNYNISVFKPPYSLRLLDPTGTREFYSAYFYMNTFFLCLTCSFLFFLLHRGDHSNHIIDFYMMFMIFMMTITQYVVVPYDTITYFFIAFSAFFILKNKLSLWGISALCGTIILATLARETTVLILAFYFTVHYQALFEKPKGIKITSIKLNQQQLIFLVITLCFILTYLSLRWEFGYENAWFQSITFKENFSNKFPVLGILFLVMNILFLIITPEGRKEILIFITVSFPCILFILTVANPWETRLWVPLIIISAIIKATKININQAVVVSKDHLALSSSGE